MLTKYSCSF